MSTVAAVPPAKLKRNLLFLYAGEGLAKGLALLAFSRLGHALGDDSYGLLALPAGIYFVFNQLLDAGLAPFGAREASKHPARTLALAARIGWLRLVLVVGALVLLAGIALVLDQPDEVRLLVVLFGTALLPMPFVVNWAFESQNQMQVVAGATFLRQVVFAGGVFLLVDGPSDLFWVPLCEAAGLVALALLQQGFFRARIGPFLPWRGRRGSRSVLRHALPLGASTIFSALRWFAPLLLLAATSEAAAAAHFESGHRIVVALHTFVWLYFVNLLPSLSRLSGQGDVAEWRRLLSGSLKLVAWTVLPGVLVGCAVAPVLLPLIYGPTFGPAAPVFRILLWMVLVAFVSGHHRYTLIAFSHQRDEMRASGIGFAVSGLAAVGLWAAGALTPAGAASALVAGEAATLVAAAGYVRARVGHLPFLRPLLAPAVCGVVAVALWIYLAPV
jgi:O-antigen/teichoic acid export membrane protein